MGKPVPRREGHTPTAMEEKTMTLREVITAAFDFQFAFAEESDRAAAVLAHARFEVWLKDTIKRRFVEIDGDFEKKHHIFHPIQFFLSKIKIGLALGLYDQKPFEGLLTVNEIRNRFAHNHEMIDFSDQKIADLCRKKTTHHTNKCVPVFFWHIQPHRLDHLPVTPLFHEMQLCRRNCPPTVKIGQAPPRTPSRPVEMPS